MIFVRVRPSEHADKMNIRVVLPSDVSSSLYCEIYEWLDQQTDIKVVLNNRLYWEINQSTLSFFALKFSDPKVKFVLYEDRVG
jgi:hypothetical protein